MEREREKERGRERQKEREREMRMDESWETTAIYQATLRSSNRQKE